MATDLPEEKNISIINMLSTDYLLKDWMVDQWDEEEDEISTGQNNENIKWIIIIRQWDSGESQ